MNKEHQPVENLDRAHAVNLARNVLDTAVFPALTEKGIKTLAEGVMAMDAHISASRHAMSIDELKTLARAQVLGILLDAEDVCRWLDDAFANTSPAVIRKRWGHTQSSERDE